MKRLLICLLTVMLTALAAVPEAEARHHVRRSHGHRIHHSRESRRTTTRTTKPLGADFFGKRKEVRGLQIDPSTRPAVRSYILSDDYYKALRAALDEALQK